MKFDVVVGNPPYQEESEGQSTQALPVYNKFYDLSFLVADKVTLITPGRFLFNAGATGKEWNRRMLSDEHLKVTYYSQDSSKIFSNTDIKGGVAVIYRDAQTILGPIGVFTNFEELNSILVKVEKKKDKKLAEIISNRGNYRYSNLIYKEHPTEMEKVSDRRIASNAFRILPNLFFSSKPDDSNEYFQIVGRENNKRVTKWFRTDYLYEKINFNKYKVILPKANGSGAIGEILSTPLIGEPLIGEPLIGYTETFIGIGKFDNRIEAENCMSYIKTKFARTLLGVLKITQDNTKEKWAKVPLQDFTKNSDIDWSKSIPEIDQQLYKKYNLSQKEIDFIESKVKSMD